MQARALVITAWREILHPDESAMGYWLCLLFQACALVIWWPKNTVVQALMAEQGPQPLTAVLIAIGFSAACYSVLIGGEELITEGKPTLREWAIATEIPIAKIVLGGLLGHCTRVLYIIALSAPLICIAYSVGGGDVASIGWILAMTIVLALFHWLLGALLYALFGQHKQTTYLSLRAAVLASYVVTATLAPEANHLIVSIEFMDALTGKSGHDAPEFFCWIYGVAVAGLSLMVSMTLWLNRRSAAPHGPAPGKPGPSNPGPSNPGPNNLR